MADLVQSPTELFSRCEEHEKTINTKQSYEFYVQEITFRTILSGDLAQQLRGARDSETQWFLLAVWMKQEKISQPKDFLPAAIYKKLTKDVREKLKISLRNLYFFNLVETWTPYFERLLTDFYAIKEKNQKLRRDRKTHLTNPTVALEKAGYHSDAVRIIVTDRKRRAVAAACAWLAGPKKGQEFRIRNAYSLIRSYLSRK